MMKNRRTCKFVALMLALVMVLGLVACGGSGSKVEHSDLVGKWSGEVMTLWFKADIQDYVLVDFDGSDMYFGYNYTIDGNVLTVNLEDMDDEMVLTLESDQLVYEVEYEGKVYTEVFTRVSDEG